MKKFAALILALMLVLLSVPSLAEEGSTFIMGFDAEYPPYTYMGDDGEYTGFDIELCKGVCDILGWNLELVPINWDTKLMTLDSGEIDCIWSGLTIDVIDPEAYTLSMAYSDNSQMILTKKSLGINTLDDLAGKIVGVQLGTSADILLQNDQAALAETFGELQRFENYNVCFTELMAGSIDAIAIDIGVAAGKIAEYGDEYVMLDESIASEQYGICFRKDDAERCAQVEEALMQLVDEGVYLSLAEKYGLDTNALCLLEE
ncbi:MAG TPA: transporter substrate-binding domain-containing protein [Candidatus Aphodomonas merdavium]|nr:transporter substrate-binding domain-containing protein [Candidatus Aphodomonas merdavium]